MKKALLAGALLLLAPTATWASCTTYACDSTTLKRIYPTLSGKVYVEVAEPISGLNCTQTEGVFMVLKSSHPLFKETYALLLSSMQSRSLIRVRIVEGSPDCEIAYVWAYAP